MNSGILNYKNATEDAHSLTHLSNTPVLGMLLNTSRPKSFFIYK